MQHAGWLTIQHIDPEWLHGGNYGVDAKVHRVAIVEERVGNHLLDEARGEVCL